MFKKMSLFICVAILSFYMIPSISASEIEKNVVVNYKIFNNETNTLLKSGELKTVKKIKTGSEKPLKKKIGGQQNEKNTNVNLDVSLQNLKYSTYSVLVVDLVEVNTDTTEKGHHDTESLTIKLIEGKNTHIEGIYRIETTAWAVP